MKILLFAFLIANILVLTNASCYMASFGCVGACLSGYGCRSTSSTSCACKPTGGIGKRELERYFIDKIAVKNQGETSVIAEYLEKELKSWLSDIYHNIAVPLLPVVGGLLSTMLGKRDLLVENVPDFIEQELKSWLSDIYHNIAVPLLPVVGGLLSTMLGKRDLA